MLQKKENVMLKLILSAGIICLVLAAPRAQASTSLQFGLSDPSYTYLSGANEIFIENQNLVEAGSTMTVQTRDEATQAVQDSTGLATYGLNGYNDTFLADLTLTSNGPSDWSASGTLTFTDVNVAFPVQQALAANFQSTRVWFSGSAAGGYQFGITGLLTPQAGGTMLVNRGSPWVFTGNTAGGPPDADGNPLTISADGQPYYSGGTATFISNLTADNVGDIISLDDLMQYSFYTEGASTGLVAGTAAVPEPLTMIGLAMSIGAVGGYLRKRLKLGA
jgi:hypothetical protein